MAKHGPDEGWRQHVIDNVLPRMEATTEQATGFTPAPANPQPFSAGMHLQPQFDPIELLPPAAAEKLRLLRQRAADAHALIPTGFDDQVREASRREIEAANALKRLTDHPQDGGFNLPPDDRARHRRATDARQGDRRFRAAQAAQRDADGGMAGGERRAGERRDMVAKWQARRHARCEDCRGRAPKLNKGETGLLDAIENCAGACRELRADLHRIASAPFPRAYAKSAMRAQIEALAMQGAPSVSRLIELDGTVEFQTQHLQSEVHAERRAVAFTEDADAVALIAWLHKDALIAALDREIASEADDKAALTHEARQKAEAEVMGDLLAVERDESCACVAGAGARSAGEHRADISPLALLGSAAGHGTARDPSPEHRRSIRSTRCAGRWTPIVLRMGCCLLPHRRARARGESGRGAVLAATSITNRAAGQRLLDGAQPTATGPIRPSVSIRRVRAEVGCWRMPSRPASTAKTE